MVTEDYVSFEIAKLLKEKGFDVSCYGRYSVRSKEFHLDYTKAYNNGSNFMYSAPTHQMAMKWLREVHNRYIEISVDTGYIYGDVVFKSAVYDGDLDCVLEPESFPTYEEAVDAALKYVLENLI